MTTPHVDMHGYTSKYYRKGANKGQASIKIYRINKRHHHSLTLDETVLYKFKVQWKDQINDHFFRDCLAAAENELDF